MKLEAGMQVWWEPSRLVSAHSKGSATSVTKVGRQWAYLANGYRVDIDGMWADGKGYSSPGRIWPSEREAQEDRRLRAAWMDFTRDVYRAHCPADATVESINAMRRSLGLEIWEVSP